MELAAGLIGAVVGAIFGTVGALLTLRFNYRQLYAETVSRSRNLWLNELREFISKMVAEARPKEDNKKTKDYYIYRNQVLMRLNIKEPFHKRIEQLVYRFDRSVDENNFAELQKEIIEVSRKVIKLEWETVKKEAKGGK